MKNKIYILIIILCNSITILAQTPNWLWAKSSSGMGEGTGTSEHSIATDINGNVYITGGFSDSIITFGNITLTNSSFASPNPNNDIFVVKYDVSGNVLWAKSAGGKSDDDGTSISIDHYGNIYLTGYFNSRIINFGSININNSDPTGNSADLFLAKYDTSGDVLWVKRAGGYSNDFGNSVKTNVFGDIFLVGHFQSSSITFDSITINNSLNYIEMFIAKYDSTGKVQWVKKPTNNATNLALTVDVDTFGNSYVAGKFFNSSIKFDTTTLMYAGGGFSDIFIAKYNANGNVLWAKSIGSLREETAYSISVDKIGNAYLTGYFTSSILKFDTITLYNSGGFNIYISKFDSTGNVIWAKSAGGIAVDEGYSVSLDSIGEVYIVGSFTSLSITFGSTTLINAGNYDIFIAKYNTNGEAIWAKSIGGTNYDYGFGSIVDKNGDVFITGIFLSPKIIFGATTLTSNGSANIFVAKLSSTITNGIEEYKNSLSRINIYPNPSEEKFTIDFLNNNETKTIRVYNLLGKIIKEIQTSNLKTEIETDQFDKGIYLINIQSTDGNYNSKIVIK